MKGEGSVSSSIKVLGFVREGYMIGKKKIEDGTQPENHRNSKQRV
jgi:hypothetical protein